jgi:hypothetical protein
LEIDHPVETLASRYELFEGIPRYVLTKNESLYNDGKQQLWEAVEKVKSLEDIENLFKAELDLETIVHRVMKYVPGEVHPNRFALSPLSKAVFARL